MENLPNSMGPPCRASSSSHMACSLAMSACTPGLSRQTSAPISGRLASMFIGQCVRRAVKPACISAQMLRARARAAGSAGQRCLSGKRSARVSAMARESQTARPPSTSTGTLPTGFRGSTWRLNSELAAMSSKGTMISSKAMPDWRISTQGRIDQDE